MHQRIQQSPRSILNIERIEVLTQDAIEDWSRISLLPLLEQVGLRFHMYSSIDSEGIENSHRGFLSLSR